jgi:anti-anti-sigma factor
LNISQVRYADVVVASLTGRVDHSNAEELRTGLAPVLEACARGRDKVVLNLGYLEYISSAGLRVLMLAARQAKDQGGDVVVANSQPVVQQIFEISRFNLLFKMFESVGPAIAELSPAASQAYSAKRA